MIVRPLKSKAKISLKSKTDALIESGHVLGWREWVSLPDFDVPLIKAKVDTGPHYRGDGHPRVKCEAPLVDIREIRSSNGETDERIVISTHIGIGAHHLKVEMTLANRSLMGFPMLLGRTAMKAGRFLVLPTKSYLAGQAETVYTAGKSDVE